MAILGPLKCLFREHAFGNWDYVVPDTCVQERRCRRCCRKEGRIVHRFGDWRYIKDGGCLRSRRCERCGIGEESIDHEWSAWRFSRPGTCERERTCRRCGAGEVRIEHTWSEWTEQADKRERVCLRCRALLTEQRCERCGGLGRLPDPERYNCHSCAGLGAEVCCCECLGTGYEHTDCPDCRGSGWVQGRAFRDGNSA